MKQSIPSFPKDKHDIEAAEFLYQSDPESLIEYIPHLTYYLCDWNWPVTSVIAKVLSRQKSQNLIPYFIQILQRTELIDSDLKRGILYFVMDYFEQSDVLLLKDELLALLNHPSAFDIEEGLSELAEQILSQFGLSKPAKGQ